LKQDFFNWLLHDNKGLDRQRTYYVTLKCVRATIVAVEKHITYFECMFVALGIQYPMHMWPVPLNYIFPHYLLNGTIFRKKLLNIKCMF